MTAIQIDFELRISNCKIKKKPLIPSRLTKLTEINKLNRKKTNLRKKKLNREKHIVSF